MKDPKISCATCFYYTKNVCRMWGYYWKDEIADKTMCKDWYYVIPEVKQ